MKLCGKVVINLAATKKYLLPYGDMACDFYMDNSRSPRIFRVGMVVTISLDLITCWFYRQNNGSIFIRLDMTKYYDP